MAAAKNSTSKLGLVSMDNEKQREMSSKDGSAIAGNMASDTSKAGAKDGSASGGNFAKDRQKAGKKGGSR